MTSEIEASFGTVDKEVAEKLVLILNIYNKSIDDLFVSWELFAVARLDSSDGDLNMVNVEKFQKHLQDTIAQKNMTPLATKKRVLKLVPHSSSPAPDSTPLKRQKMTPFRTPRANFTLSPGYETAGDSSYVEPYSSPIRKSQSVNSNTVIETLNPEIAVVEHDDHIERSHQITANFELKKYKFRTMAMKVLESADYLDDQIDLFGDEYLRYHGVNSTNENRSSELGNPCVSSQTDLICVGRIVPDLTAYDSKPQLNDSSLCLETLRTYGIGQRVPLDLSLLPSYLFFPGQIVVLRGRNPSGSKFIVLEILANPKLPLSYSTPEDLSEYTHGVKLVVASGPYSPGQFLDYSKFELFVQYVNTVINPDVVVLCGPFVDITNASVRAGMVSGEKLDDDDEIFRQMVVPIIKQFNSNTLVILVPSLRDAAIKHIAYPQDLFDKKRFGLPKNVKVMPNPANFAINEVMFGVSTLDVFKDMCEVAKGASSNRFERVVSHVIDQRRFYPIFPGLVDVPKSDDPIDGILEGGAHGQLVATTDIGGSCLDMPYMGLAEFGAVVPDVLVMPSQLTHFAKIVEGVVAINPGQFIRGHKDPSKQTGSYTVISVEAPSVGVNVEDTDGQCVHSVYKRCRVEIYRS